jgi:hypothetical protein
MKTTISDYEQQAIDFLQSTGTEFLCEFLKYGKHFQDDKESRDIYKITLKRGKRSYSFNFGQSIAKSKRFQDKLNKRIYTQSGGNLGDHNYRFLYPEKFPKNVYEEKYGDFKVIQGEAPNAYDVLACITKNDPYTFENFCSEFGYDTDSRKAKKVYKAVLNEWQNISMLFSDSEIEKLQEIQ